jgi:hypothetical protein
MVFLFIHVYRPAYSAMFDAPSRAVVGFTIVQRMKGPDIPVATANPAA